MSSGGLEQGSGRPGFSRRRVLCSDWLRKWGKYSYGIYIVHLPLLGALEWKTGLSQHGVALLGGSRLPGVLLLAAVGMSISYTLGWLSYHVYEKRFLELKRSFARQAATWITAPVGPSASATMPRHPAQ